MSQQGRKNALDLTLREHLHTFGTAFTWACDAVKKVNFALALGLLGMAGTIWLLWVTKAPPLVELLMPLGSFALCGKIGNIIDRHL